MDAFMKIAPNLYKCGRCGFQIKSKESPYHCVKCWNLNHTKMEKIYFEKHSEDALNESSKRH